MVRQMRCIKIHAHKTTVLISWKCIGNLPMHTEREGPSVLKGEENIMSIDPRKDECNQQNSLH